ncbi:hypothetical protein SPAN111604_04195 [Sphingomonas antarctica]
MERLHWLLSRAEVHLLSASALRDYAKLGLVLAVTILLEVARRRNWRVRYGGKSFRLDLLYFVFYYGGFYHILFFTWIYVALTGLVARYTPGLQLNLLYAMPGWLQMVAMIATSDFVGYWSHRWRHSHWMLWEFHSIHHSQQSLTAVTNYRFHMVDETLLRLWLFIPFQILGTTVTTWITLDFIMAWLLLIQHSEWDWHYGRLGRVFVSPVFHRKHHARAAELHDTNYGMLFSFWDDLFGTAERKLPAPTVYGVDGPEIPESFIGQLLHPFRSIWTRWRGRGAPLPDPAPSTSA